ncbi:MAG: hypothetical protein DMG96_06365 [Acidobacteria bacterium]|nr:MAG: hypothetical protein DMG96_06365 [Acidobacteriota bacterium]
MGRYCTSALPLDKREWQDFWKSRFPYWEQNSLPTLTDNLVAPPFRRTLAKGGSQNETNPTLSLQNRERHGWGNPGCCCWIRLAQNSPAPGINPVNITLHFRRSYFHTQFSGFSPVAFGFYDIDFANRPRILLTSTG